MTERLSEHKGWQMLVKSAMMSPTEIIVEALAGQAEHRHGQMVDLVDQLRDQLTIAVARAESAERKLASVESYRDTCAILGKEPSTAGLIVALRDDSEPVRRAHNHPPYDPVCNERVLPGKIGRGACLHDDGRDVR